MPEPITMGEWRRERDDQWVRSMRDLCAAVTESTEVAPNLMVIGPESPVAVEFEKALRAGGVAVGGRLLSPREQRGEAFWRGM